MKLLVGLGNPGGEYAGHRHNVGFMALDRIAAGHSLGAWRKRFHGLWAEGSIGGRKVALLKPQTYMNESGRSVGEAQRYLKIAPGDVIVFHDELDLAPGKIKVKTGGGNAGHNGLRSISAHIGNEYARVRIGIGHPGAKELVHGYVLHDFAKADRDWLDTLLDAIADGAGRLAAGDEARFLTDVARGSRVQERVERDDPGDPGKSAAQPAARSLAGRHPAGEGQSKRAGALAENLKRWLSGRK